MPPSMDGIFLGVIQSIENGTARIKVNILDKTDTELYKNNIRSEDIIWVRGKLNATRGI